MTALINKWVKVMADYGTDGMWDLEGCPLCMEEIEALDLGPFILARLKKWVDWYETNDDWSAESALDFDYKAFAEEGLQIAKAVKARLPEYAVWYFDEWQCQKDIGNTMSFGNSSYEVK